jgi:hypothetical protein
MNLTIGPPWTGVMERYRREGVPGAAASLGRVSPFLHRRGSAPNPGGGRVAGSDLHSYRDPARGADGVGDSEPIKERG